MLLSQPSITHPQPLNPIREGARGRCEQPPSTTLQNVFSGRRTLKACTMRLHAPRLLPGKTKSGYDDFMAGVWDNYDRARDSAGWTWDEAQAGWAVVLASGARVWLCIGRPKVRREKFGHKGTGGGSHAAVWKAQRKGAHSGVAAGSRGRHCTRPAWLFVATTLAGLGTACHSKRSTPPPCCTAEGGKGLLAGHKERHRPDLGPGGHCLPQLGRLQACMGRRNAQL